MDIDPFDKRKADIEDQMLRAAEDRAHWKEAVWLLTHTGHLYPRFEENREWYLRLKAWQEKQTAQSED